VPLWATLNEPWVVVDAGYLHGTHAPGHRSPFEAPRAAHHLLRAHAAAVRAFRAAGRVGRIGLVLNLEPKDPASASPADVAAAARADAQMNRHYLDAVFFGRYPTELEAIFGEGWPDFGEREMAGLREPLDFLGINYYTRGVTRHDDAAWPTRARTVPVPGAEYTAVGWEVHPASLTGLLLRVRERYGDLPLYITENGAALADPPHATAGRVDDPRRIAYFHSHLRALRDAMAQGVDVRGYFAWSLLDNFEWGHGYSKRFGLLHVDYATQKRTPKASAHFYREVIRTRGAVLDQPPPAPGTLPGLPEPPAD
jgi:beta-glucosidase